MFKVPEQTKSKTTQGIISLIVVLAVGAYMVFGMNMSYALSDIAITIVKSGNIVIPFEEISDVQYMPVVPALSNRVGSAVGARRSGTFTVADIGRGKVYATDITKPCVVIFTPADFYVITPNNAQDFYDQVRTKIGR